VPGQFVTCVEVGASGVETVLLGPDDSFHAQPGLVQPPPGSALAIAVPGFVADGRVVAASNLDWWDVDPAEALGLHTRAQVVCNDAEAAALGESVLRPGSPDLVFVGLGTGVGGAVVRAGEVSANLFAHQTGFGTALCSCTNRGCLETVAGGWALPTPLTDLASVAAALATAIEAEPLAGSRLVVLAGGIARAYPALVELLAQALPERTVEPTAARDTKSAAAWGLQALLTRAASAV
jgi:glucokinase